MGDFYKLLPYGSYIMKVEKEGYDTFVNGVFINNIGNNIDNVTKISVTLISSGKR